MNICVVGTGYVGLVTGACLADFGMNVVCVDKDEAKISALQAGRIPIYEPGLEEIVAKNERAGRLRFTTDLKFGIENYQVAAVPPGTVETARPGMGHYHVAVDSECLTAGTAIVKAAPWVHFGDGKAEIDMQLPPGMHKLTLQLGDDLHRAVDTLCTSINVNVSE